MRITPLLILILSCAVELSAQTLNFEIGPINNASALPSEEIRRIYQDKEGFMWFGSPKGLMRYDGYDIIHYSAVSGSSDALSHNNVTTIADDSTRIWVGTYRGVSVIDKLSQKVSSFDSRLAESRIYKILIDGDNVWIATRPDIYRYNSQTDELKVYSLRGQVLNGDVNDVLLTRNGDLWLATSYSMGLYKYDRDRDDFEIYPELFKNHELNILWQDRDDNIWVGSRGEGVVVVSNYSKQVDKIEKRHYINDSRDSSTISGDLIYSFAQDSISGSIWIGHHKGLSILENPQQNDKFRNIKFDGSSTSIRNNSVSATFCDREGDIWLGTMGGGVNRISFSQNMLVHNSLLAISKSCNSRYITAACDDKYGRLWLGVKDYGLVLYDPLTDEHIDIIKNPIHKKWLANNRIRTIFAIGDRIYIGTSGRGILFGQIPSNGKRSIALSRLNIKDMHATQYITTSHKDVAGNYWVGCGNGIMVINSKGQYITRVNQMRDEQPLSITSISSDKEGNVWVASDFSGVFKCRLSGRKIGYERYTVENEKSLSNTVLSICCDKDMRVWCSTGDGQLMQYDKQNNRFESKNEHFNLAVTHLYNIFEDGDGNIWADNSNSMFRFTNDSYQKFSHTSGNSTNVLNEECSVLPTTDGSYILGGFSGYTTLYPDRVGERQVAPPIRITDIEVNYNSIYGAESDEDIQFDGSSLILKRKSNNISIKFAALRYNVGENIEYAYKLENFDSRWNYVGADSRKATYTNLPRGKYKFKVRTLNENGMWSERVTTLDIRILPAPSGTWWAYLIYVIVVVMSLYAGYRIFSYRIRLQRRLKYANFRNRQSELLIQSKLRFFTNITHELLTPLTIIGCAVEQLSGCKDQSDRGSISILQNNAERLMRLIRQILEFRKAENDKLMLQTSQVEICNFVRDISEKSFRLLAQRKNIEFSIETPDEEIVGWIDTDKLDKILYNLLSNAFKYNFDNSYVKVVVQQVESSESTPYRILKLMVKDGGIGIAPDQLDGVFTRFYDGMYRQTNTQGSGIGLSLTKSLTELHKGNIKVESVLGMGSKFIVSIPIDHEAYVNSEKEPEKDEVSIVDEEKTNDLESYDRSILVVEDNDDLRDLIASLLSCYNSVFTATDGVGALEILRNNQVDMVVSDVMMPRMDGIELCREMKGDIEHSSIPVILLTAKDSEEDKIKGYECGADAYVVKPFKSELLLSRIRNIFNSRSVLISNFQNNKSDSIQLSTITYTTIDEKLMQKAVEVVQENISNEDFNFNAFADDMKISKSTLYRKIKSLTGMTTSDFIKDIRLRQAAKLLKADSSIAISEVAYSVGFGQPKYFSTCFKKKYGVLPSEYHAMQVEAASESD